MEELFKLQQQRSSAIKKFFPALDDEEEEEEKYIQEIIKKWERIEEKSLTPNIRVEWPAFSPYAATQYLSLFTWK